MVKISSESLPDRPVGIMFFLFYFRINPNQEDSCIKKDSFCFQFQKVGKKKLNKDNFIQCKKYTTKFIQHKNTTQGAHFRCGLRGITPFPKLGWKSHYQNQKDGIPYQSYVYIKIHCNHNKPIHSNARSEGGSLIFWCYGVPTVVLWSAYQNTFLQYAYNTKFINYVYTTRQYNMKNEKLSRKKKLDFTEVIKRGLYIRKGLGFSLYLLTQKSWKEEGTEKQIKLKTVKEVMHQSLTLDG